MKIKIRPIKILMSLIIIFSNISSSLLTPLNFAYPQTYTLTNKNILVVEKNGIYICNPSYENIISTVKEFPESEKITDEIILSKTIIKKSSIFILIFSSNKLYVIKTQDGSLLIESTSKLFEDNNADYFALAYSYQSSNFRFVFTVGYLTEDSNNDIKLILKYYEILYNYSTEKYYYTEYNTLSLNSVTRTYSSQSYTFKIQKKGLNCDNLSDYYDDTINYITCFVMAKVGDNDYLIPLTFEDGETSLTFKNDIYDMQYIKINNVRQIKTRTNMYLEYDYVCYVTEDNIASCTLFYLYSRTWQGIFDSDEDKSFTKNCRGDIYGMKVTLIFETSTVAFSCSDTDGSLQVYFFDDEELYLKFEDCENIYGYSVIYLEDSSNYYVSSDVTCPKGKVPYTPLINSGEDIYVKEPTETIVENPSTIITLKMREDSTVITEQEKFDSTIITEKINEDSTILTEKAKMDSTLITEQFYKDSTVITHKTVEETTEKISEENFDTKNLDYDCPESCLECNTDKKCIKCNKNKGYYPIELSSMSNPFQTLICLNETLKNIDYPDFYLDSEIMGNESFKPCFEKCASCYGKGDGNDNNCKNCTEGYILHPEYTNSKECVPQPNSLYYIKYGQYTTTNSDYCPNDFNYLIPEKKKCIEDCQKDLTYRYTYDDICYSNCPENTHNDSGEFICKDDPDKCIYTKKILYTLNEKITNNEIEKLISKYAKEYEYTNNHISLYENNIYIITIYKNGQCLFDLGLSTKTIDFGVCYDKVKNKIMNDNNLNTNCNLIVVQIKTKPGKDVFDIKPAYGLYNPLAYSAINLEEECKNDKVNIQNNFTEEFNNSKVSLDTITKMAEQGINLFDPYNPFYNDLCTHYPSILDKDIPLKKRIIAYYPGIELCDDNCDLVGVFLNNKTAKCECSLSDNGNKKESFKDNALYQKQIGQFEEFLYMTNINVIQCYEGVFQYEYFIKSYGGFIIMGLIIIQIIATIIYFSKSKFYVKKYIFGITNRYLEFLVNNNIDYGQKNCKLTDIKGTMDKISLPPRKTIKTPIKVGMEFKKPSKSIKGGNLITNNEKTHSHNHLVIFSNDSKDKLKFLSKVTQKPNDITYKTKRTSMNNYTNNNKISYEKSVCDNLLINVKDNFDINMKEFLKTDPDNMDYDDALRRDERTFCRYYWQKIQTQQILINTFFYKEYLKPISIKIVLLVLQIDLYFFINALFYNEEYITKIFELEKDTFSNTLWRFLDNLFYAFLVGVIINYIIEFFFIEEKKLKVTLKREKNNLLILKYEMMQIIKDLEKRYISFIIISFIILLFTWYHISCFNHIYQHMKKEWIIFSVLIIVCIQVISLLTSLAETIIRFLSFRFKSERLFKLSLIFS